MVYVVGLPAPAFPALGPQVGWPDTNIGPTWPTCPTPLVPKIIPVFGIPFLSLCGKNRGVSRFPVFEMLAVCPFLVVKQVPSYRTDQGKE